MLAATGDTKHLLRRGLTENDAHENDGPKLQDTNLRDINNGQPIGDAFAPPLPEIFMSSQSQPFIAGYENAGHETAGQKNKNAAFRYFLNTQHSMMHSV